MNTWNVPRSIRSVFVGRSSPLYVAILLVVGTLIYLPGLHGPYLFDDQNNLLANTYVQLREVTSSSLRQAAFSLESGPLQRPVSVLSFALNYWLAGGFDRTVLFKGVNLAIHLINGILVFILAQLVLRHASSADSRSDNLYRRLLPALIALLWTVHPIQLTTVLYVVQRMTSLAALFTLAALCVYLLGRNRLAAGQRRSGWLLMLGAVALGALGIFSKETAVLLPLYIAVVELTLFRGSAAKLLFRNSGRATAWAVALGIVAVLVLAVLWTVGRIEPRYAHMPFTMEERLLTQFRVLFFYLSLLLVPSLNRFGLYHDDFVLSTSWLEPWTTLVSFLGMLLVLGGALALRKREPLIAFGLLWFFVGHSLESTILPLELVHEHRNYVPSLGIVLTLLHVLTHPGLATRAPTAARAVTWLIPVIVLASAATTAMRATQWSDMRTFSVHEVLHHPRSARAHATLGTMLVSEGRPAAALDAMQQAAALDPTEPGYLLLAVQISANHDFAISPALWTDLDRRLRARATSALTRTVMGEITNCLPHVCRPLAAPMVDLVHAAISATPENNYRLQSYWYHILGRAQLALNRLTEAFDAFERSHALDPDYLHPLFDLLQMHVATGDRAAAGKTLVRLMRANERTRFPRDRELLAAAQLVYAMDQEQPGQRAQRVESQ